MRSIFLAALALAPAACSKNDPLYCDNAGKGTPECGGTMIDAPAAIVDTVDLHCLGPAGTAFVVCLGANPGPASAITLPATIDTTAGLVDSLCLSETQQPAGWTGAHDACVVVGSTITSDASTTTRVTGPRPLVLYAATTITITKDLIVASLRADGTKGPGADPTNCTGGTPGAMSVTGEGGGGGGSFHTLGGDGGSNTSAAPAAGGTATAIGSKSTLRGGCAGTLGGGLPAAVGAAGPGGGAVYLVAGTQIKVTSTINASGAGASSGTALAGGSGGGSGGMIAMFAPSIETSTGLVFANGGGGSGGGDGGSNAGLAGGDALSPTAQATGGAKGGGGGGDGGKGYALAGDATAGGGGNGAKLCGGGGGGGGGFVLSNQTLAGMVSPTSQPF